jgi:hypothetical protein
MNGDLVNQESLQGNVWVHEGILGVIILFIFIFIFLPVPAA